ncbi:hypothetical protein VU01_11194 [Candidatus Electrothrix marina]|uniref:Uncharacterized protein n=1 Tax=Candidatus Electrothrix marina TaxID=1859130 RepID=A0A444JEN2_9BACT|nr:hypothetical protein VU01_11194 [Candidatus Electrothrix marina]
MGRAKPIILPSKTFLTQGEATKFFKDMLNRYRDEEKINNEDGKLLFELLQRHPEDKIKDKVAYFFRRHSPDQPTSCFHIMRTSGEPTDFSYPKCIKGTSPTIEEYFYKACRVAVSHYLIIKKNELFDIGNVFCCQTREEVTKETSEYRHTNPPFKKIIEEFIAINNISISCEMFFADADMQYSVRFTDDKLSKKFISFHQEKAVMGIFKKGTSK